jgi:hypothetical protein
MGVIYEGLPGQIWSRLVYDMEIKCIERLCMLASFVSYWALVGKFRGHQPCVSG